MGEEQSCFRTANGATCKFFTLSLKGVVLYNLFVTDSFNP